MKSLTVGWLLLAAVPTHKMLLKTHSSVVRTIKRHLYYYSCSCWCGTNERIPLQCKQNCWVAWKIKFFDKIRKTWAQNYVFHTQHRCSFVLRFWLLMAIWPSTALAGCLLVHNWWAQCACCVTTEDKKRMPHECFVHYRNYILWIFSKQNHGIRLSRWPHNVQQKSSSFVNYFVVHRFEDGARRERNENSDYISDKWKELDDQAHQKLIEQLNIVGIVSWCDARAHIFAQKRPTEQSIRAHRTTHPMTMTSYENVAIEPFCQPLPKFKWKYGTAVTQSTEFCARVEK